MEPIIKALPIVFMRVFTVYGNIKNDHLSDPPVRSEGPCPTARTIMERRKRMIGIIIPMLMWDDLPHTFLVADDTYFL
ncbi:hypothetical protein D9619_002320 [Psilocybe cf. subviscida]|uniref:Uncharacterized protein n=1 Tax=Psilocybe cf. subviscida TaxID=2480587 RepID=A0A8H5EUI7_9AGAR|nr:hypothetical protein D9619_002320 [Psilocybe cf. subviscida]